MVGASYQRGFPMDKMGLMLCLTLFLIINGLMLIAFAEYRRTLGETKVFGQ